MLARILLVAALVLPILSQTSVAAAATVPSVTDPRYFVGVNVPWFTWGCDFGCATTNGVSSAATQKELREGFAALRAANVHTVRWWMFEGDPWQINHDNNANPTGINPAVYQDLDAALALAEEYDLVYDFVLFSSPTALPTGWVTDDGPRQRLVDALSPMFERYKNHPRILAWELFNEPEWDTWNDKIGLSPVQATVRLLTTAIHQRTQTPVTIGSANLDGIQQWVGTGLDFYSPHWYDPMSSGNACARCTDARTFASNNNIKGVPILLGEFYGAPETDTLQRLKDFRDKGYAGAWAWSLFSDHTGDKMKVDLAAFRAFTTNASSPAPGAAASQPGAAASQPAAAAPEAGPNSAGIQLLANWVSPTYAVAGSELTVFQDVQATADTNVLVQFELVDPQGQRVAQAGLENQAISKDGITSFSTTLALPRTLAAGQYTLKTGILPPGGAAPIVGSDSAGTVTIEAMPAPTPTPRPVAPPASAPDDDGASADSGE